MYQGPRLTYNYFAHITPSHESHGYWRHPDARHMATDYLDLDEWTTLARQCERGFFDTVFFGDTLAPYEVYGGSRDTVVRTGMQFPGLDPSVLVSAMASATEHLGFVVTSSVLQAHPFEFARRMSSLDQWTNGRIGWNMVNSYLVGAARNLGLDDLPSADDRYRIMDDYTQVAYKLWEASWDEDALTMDVERSVLFDPAKVRTIDHLGKFFRSRGPHMSAPTPQRTPLLYQAGASGMGREFMGRHAELTFMGSQSPEQGAADVADLQRRAVASGRHADDILPVILFPPIIGSTEEEARRRQRELFDWIDLPGLLAFYSVPFQIDLSQIDPDRSLASLLADSAAMPERARIYIGGILDAAKDKSQTFGELLLREYSLSGRVAGTPEQIADRIQEWAEAGIRGFNITPVTTLGWVDEWVEHVVPVLQRRGLLQREYATGTLRNKIFGRGDRLPDYHPARLTRTVPVE